MCLLTTCEDRKIAGVRECASSSQGVADDTQPTMTWFAGRNISASSSKVEDDLSTVEGNLGRPRKQRTSKQLSQREKLGCKRNLFDCAQLHAEPIKVGRYFRTWLARNRSNALRFFCPEVHRPTTFRPERIIGPVKDLIVFFFSNRRQQWYRRASAKHAETIGTCLGDCVHE